MDTFLELSEFMKKIEECGTGYYEKAYGSFPFPLLYNAHFLQKFLPLSVKWLQKQRGLNVLNYAGCFL